MGGKDKAARDREKPIHKVRLDGYYICQFPVTQSIWKAIMGSENNPSFYQGDQRPVDMVSWNDCQKFIKKLKEKTDKDYRLPTEAEWEYAARGGQQSQGYLYAGSNMLEEVGWYRGNSDIETKNVGRKQPNELGIYDMSGNAFEWCQDWYSNDYYKECARRGVVENPACPEKGVDRVIRGGSWISYSEYCRLTLRDNASPVLGFSHIGFRLILSPSQLAVDPDLPVNSRN